MWLALALYKLQESLHAEASFILLAEAAAISVPGHDSLMPSVSEGHLIQWHERAQEHSVEQVSCCFKVTCMAKDTPWSGKNTRQTACVYHPHMASLESCCRLEADIAIEADIAMLLSVGLQIESCS